MFLVFLMTALLRADDSLLAQKEFARSVWAAQLEQEVEQRQHLTRAQAADPSSIFLTDRLARDAASRGEIAMASRLYRELAARRSDSLAAQFLYADFLRAQGDHDDYALQLAVAHLEKLRDKHLAEPALVERLLRLYQQQGERDKSEWLYQAYQTQPRADPRMTQMFARLLRDAEDDKTREQLDAMYRERLEQAPQDPQLARDAAEHFCQTGRIRDAIAVLRVHVRSAPSSLDLRVRLGVLLLADQQWQQGESCLLETLAIDPQLVVAHQALAKLYRRQKKPELARKHRGEVLKIRGGEPQEYGQLAEEFLQAHDPMAARKLLEKALQRNPREVDLLCLSGISHLADPMHAHKALEFFLRAEALRAPPWENPRDLFHCAEAYWLAGEKEAAEERLRDAIKRYPANDQVGLARALRLLASWWEQQQKNQAAAEALRRRAEMLETEAP